MDDHRFPKSATVTESGADVGRLATVAATSSSANDHVNPFPASGYNVVLDACTDPTLDRDGVVGIGSNHI